MFIRGFIFFQIVNLRNFIKSEVDLEERHTTASESKTVIIF